MTYEDRVNLVSARRTARDTLRASIPKENIAEVIQWALNQFSDHYSPNPNFLRSFAIVCILEHQEYYNVPVKEIGLDQLLVWSNLEETFMDAFGD